jgi:tetratricopeptide (TPR) repeat protein
MADDVAMLRAGALVDGRFTVQRPAGAGGMGHVYRAIDELSGGATALKVCSVDTEDARARFTEEARILAQLSHPGIVRYLAHGRLPGGALYFAMEWVDGDDLAQRLARGPLSLREATRLLHGAASALGAAHAVGVVHRDVKPANLTLARELGDAAPSVARVKVLDFGIARAAASDANLTRTGTTIGTPAYMAPEQVRGERALDARVDVFALGAVFLECITGRPAFGGEHAMAVLAKVLLTDPPRLCELIPGAPAALDELVRAMLSKDPAARPRDGGEVARALAPLLDSPDLDARRAAVAALVAAAEPAADTRLAPTGAVTGLTASERRIACVVLVGAADAGETVPIAALAIAAPRWNELADGSVVFVFEDAGEPMDRAAQAARCAIAMRDALGSAPVAIAMGWVGDHRRRFDGDVLDRAAQLIVDGRRGVPGAGRPVWIDAGVASLLGARFDVREAAGGLLLYGEHETAPVRRPLLGLKTPFVGRGGELRQLEGIFATCVEDGTARAAVVIAPAGVGKSRLRAELGERLRQAGAEVWTGAGDPLRAGAAFASLGDALRGAAGLVDGEPIEVRRDKLVARVERSCVGADAARIAPFLGEIVGAPFADDASVQLAAARREPILMSDQMRRAFEDFVAAEAGRRPIVLMLEDFHWGDAPTVSAVDAVLRNLQGLPFLVVAWGRPELRARFPALWEARGATALHLGPLPRRAALDLVRAVLPADLPPAAADEIVERSEGNAFYLEELIRAAAASGGREPPTAVLAMVEARLAAVDADARRVLRAASLFGARSRRSDVRALLSADLDDVALDAALARVVDRELVVRQVGADGEAAYSFRHALVREAAYATLTEPDRVLGHGLAATWLEGAGGADAQMLAEHYRLGGAPARAAGWYRRAAEQALDAGDFAGACERVERVVACGASGALLGEARAVEAEAWRWRGDWLATERAARAALALLPAGSSLHLGALATAAVAAAAVGSVQRLTDDARAFGEAPADETLGPWVAAAARVAIALVLAGRAAHAAEIIDRFPRTPVSDPRGAALVLKARATKLLAEGDPGGWIDHMRLAVERFEEAGDLREACTLRANTGYCLIALGAFAEAESELRAVIVVGTRLNAEIAVTHAKHNLGLVLGYLGRLDEAQSVETEAVLDYERRGSRRMLGLSRAYRAWLLGLAGDLDAAEAEGRAAILVLDDIAPASACALGILARILVRRGSPDALAVARRGMDLLEGLGALDDGEATLRLAWAEALAAAGRAEDARGAALDARAFLERVAGKLADPARRASFLHEVPENARILDLAALSAAPRAAGTD